MIIKIKKRWTQVNCMKNKAERRNSYHSKELVMIVIDRHPTSQISFYILQKLWVAIGKKSLLVGFKLFIFIKKKNKKKPLIKLKSFHWNFIRSAFLCSTIEKSMTDSFWRYLHCPEIGDFTSIKSLKLAE